MIIKKGLLVLLVFIGASTFAQTKELTIYPNPFTSTVTIDFGKTARPTYIYIYNTNGSLVKEFALGENDSNTFDFSDLKPGIYSVIYKEMNEIIKIIKK